MPPHIRFQNRILNIGDNPISLRSAVFKGGKVQLMLDAANGKRIGCSGWALEKLLYMIGEKKRESRTDRVKKGAPITVQGFGTMVRLVLMQR